MANSLTVWSSTDDGYLSSYDASYSNARGTFGSRTTYTTGTTFRTGQYYSGSTYYCYESFVSFDTSSIGSGSTVTLATLSLYGNSDVSDTDFVLRARIHDWGATIETTDWVVGDSLDTKTIVAHYATSGTWSTSGYNALADDALPANVSKTGTTYVLLHSDRQEDTGGGPYTPTGNEYVISYSADDSTAPGGTGCDPKLYVEYTSPGGRFEVALDMFDLGCSNPASAETTFLRSQIYLDPSDYDGATYYFEVVAYNQSGSSQNVSLVYWDGDSWEEVTYATVTNQNLYYRFRSSSFSPITGNQKYALRLPSLGTADWLRINCARIIVVQRDATKTRLQIPLTSSNWANSQFNLNDNSYYIVQRTTNSYGTSSTYLTRYQKRESELATIGTWSLECVAAMSDASAGNGGVCLGNVTDTQTIASSELTISGTTPTLYSVDFSNGATYFDDGDKFKLYYKGDGTYNVNIQKSALYVSLTNLTKAAIYIRIMWQSASGTTAYQWARQRYGLNTNNFGGDSVTYLHEQTGQCADNAESTYITYYDGGATDSGFEGGFTGSGINFNYGTTDDKRSSSVTPYTTIQDIGTGRYLNTNGHSAANGFLVVLITAGGTPASNRSSLLQFGIA